MSLTGAAPWTVPPNYLAAMEGGSRLGLAVRQQDTAESEAGDRLRLAYSQLASQERRASEAARAKIEQGNAALALKSQQADLMAQFRNRALDQREQAAADLTDYRNQRLEQIDNAQAKALADRGQGEFFNDPVSGARLFRQNTGHVLKIAAPQSEARITLGPDGVLKSASGRVGDPMMQKFAGTNMPPSLQPQPFFNVVPGTPSDALPDATPQYDSAESVRAAVRAGSLSRDAAKKLLQAQFGYE